MEPLTVLSPHRDDAVFSTGLALSYFSAKPVRLSILNFFTISQYTPRVSASSVAEASAIRLAEDLLALRTISPEIEETSLGLLDAPLRPGIHFHQVTQLSTSDLLDQEFVARLTTQIGTKCKGHLLLAPLSLGNHIDHIAVLRAALRAGNADLGFYEDLPYAAQASPDEFSSKVSWAEKASGVPLKPVLISIHDPVAAKRRLAALYRSQILPEAAKAIAEFANTYGGAERLWIPSTSTRWSALLS